jgi:response regulator RpfG family c-di-GMP phosphodiesterase
MVNPAVWANFPPDFSLLQGMARPTFLIAEPQPIEGISAHKLVLDAVRYNVITAYHSKEALELLAKFPAVDGVITHSEMNDYRQILERKAKENPNCLTVLLSPGATAHHPTARFHLSSHDPKQLLDMLVDRFGQPD